MLRSACLVVDSGGFLKGSIDSLASLASKFYTLSDVVKEIKDDETRLKLSVLPFDLELKQPNPASLTFVSEFSKKTGDYAVLSSTDLKVLALAHQLVVETSDDSGQSLKKEPEPPGDLTRTKDNSGLCTAGFYVPPPNDDSEKIKTTKDIEDDDDDDDDGEGWITPSNIKKIKEKHDRRHAAADDGNDGTLAPVACMTTDFAMQNVLLQIGIPVVSVDGYVIRQARTYALHCHACMKITRDSTRVFCFNCGNKTLRRVSMTTDTSGKTQYHVGKRNQFTTTRGTKYSLPLPKGGKHSSGEEPILKEDQIITSKPRRMKKMTSVDALDPNYVARESPFALKDVASRGAQLAFRQRGGGTGGKSKNPNEVRRRKSGKRKK
ncbi:RNA-binding protein NOB1-like [Oscarella lobularis]|uniref:RNA-binding protein NOB1-like n=1 Tax=Oscarella lobularis TaxID=121494 RepID=UPI0033135AF8